MLISKILMGIISLVFISIYSHVAISSTGGVIYFRGGVFEPPCVIKPQSGNINFSCVRPQVVHQHKLSLNKIGKGYIQLNNLAYVKLSKKHINLLLIWMLYIDNF